MKYDIVVLGAGIAGISAAIKAGSMGAKTILIEQYGFLGGMSSAGMVGPFMNHYVDNKPLVKGVFHQIEEEMQKSFGMIDNGFFASNFRNATYSLLKSYNVDILLNTVIIKSYTENSNISSIDVLNFNKIYNIESKVFIDTTGDAQLLFLSKIPTLKGDEKTGVLQAMTLFFRMGNIDLIKAIDYVKNNLDNFFQWVEKDFNLNKIISIAGYFEQVNNAKKQNLLNKDVNYIFFTTLPETGEASFNCTNILSLDGSLSSDLTKAELIGREQVFQIVDILKNEIPGFENSILLETAYQVGVRETRRVIGDYIITEDDLLKCRKFDHPIARGCYGIDIHGAKGEEDVMQEIEKGRFYEIPMEALYVKGIRNVLSAGKSISATRKAHGALRIMPTSSATGEACGAIAALSVKKSIDIRDIDYTELKNYIINNLN